MNNMQALELAAMGFSSLSQEQIDLFSTITIEYYAPKKPIIVFTPQLTRSPVLGDKAALFKNIEIQTDLEQLSKSISKFFENDNANKIGHNNTQWKINFSPDNYLEIKIFRDSKKKLFFIEIVYRFIYENNLVLEFVDNHFQRLFNYIKDIGKVNNIVARIEYLKFSKNKFVLALTPTYIPLIYIPIPLTFTPIQKFMVFQNRSRQNWKMHILSFLSTNFKISKFE